MKMPLTPYKPKEPVKPTEFYKNTNYLTIGDKSYSLEELLSLFPKEIKKKDIIFIGDYNYGNDYGDGSGYFLMPAYFTFAKNKKYESELKKYNKEYIKYSKELKEYESKLSIYNLELEKYNAWLASEEKIKIEEELNKTLKKVAQLQKKLNK